MVEVQMVKTMDGGDREDEADGNVMYGKCRSGRGL